MKISEMNLEILNEGIEFNNHFDIKNLHRTKSGLRATIHDREDYSVSVTVIDSEIIDMKCTCRQSKEEGCCKHEAVLLMKGTEKGWFPFYDYYPILIKKRIQSFLAGYNQSGWLSSHEQDHLMNEFYDCFMDLIEPMIKDAQYLNAFDSINTVYLLLNEIHIEADNALDRLVYHIEEYWQEIISHAAEKQKDQMYAWFIQMKSKAEQLQYGKSIEAALDCYFMDRKYLLVRLDEIREILKCPEKIKNINRLLDQYKFYLESCDLNIDEYEKWLEKHDRILEVKQKRLEYFSEKGDIDREISLVEAYYQKEKLTEKGRYWETVLFDLYKQTGDTEKAKEMLKIILLERGSTDKKMIHELRSLCGKEEWDSIRELYLQRNPEMKVPIYAEENLEIPLLKALKSASYDTIEYYCEKYIHKYPEQFLHIYTMLLNRMERMKFSPTVNRQMKETLLKVEKMPNGRDVVIDCVNRWEMKYSHRKSMLEMLKEVKREIKYETKKKTIVYETLDI